MKTIDKTNLKAKFDLKPGETFDMGEETRQHFTDRRKAIFDAYMAGGRSMAEIGLEFGVSGERVRQIVALGRQGKLDVRSRKDVVPTSQDGSPKAA